MLPRRLALLAALLAFAACVDARAPTEGPACATEPECAKLYRAALLRLQACRRDARQAGYVNPGVQAPPECQSIQSEVEGLAAAVARHGEQRQQGSGEEGAPGFEVPPLSSGKAP